MLNKIIPRKYLAISFVILTFTIVSTLVVSLYKNTTNVDTHQVQAPMFPLEFQPVDTQNDPNRNYTKDNAGHVYFINRVIEDADAKTFSILPVPKNSVQNSIKFRVGDYAKDKNHIYNQGEVLNMDPKNSPQPDLSTFTIVGYAYAKDKSHVYNIAKYYNSDVRIVNKADLETFEEVSSQYSGNNPGYAYAKDKSHVYFYDSILAGVDPETFEFIAEGACDYDTGKCWPRITKDKNCIYHDDKKVLEVGNICVSPTKCTTSTINANCGIK